MFDYISLPKDSARRATALKDIAATFSSIVSYQQNVVSGQTPEQTLIAFMQKHLNPSECSGFLGMVFEGEELPEEFADLNIETIEGVVTDTLQLTRRFDVNDLLSVENGNELSRLASLCKIPFDRKDRRAFLANLFADMRNFHRLFVVCAGLNEFFSQRYAFDAAGETSNWISLRARINPESIVDNDDAAGKDVILHLSNAFGQETIQRFALIVGVERVSSARTLAIRLASLGPQEILKRLLAKNFIDQESFDRWVDFKETDFEEFFDCFTAACLSAHTGEAQEMIDVNAVNNSDSSVEFDEFSTYLHTKFGEDIEEDDDEEDDEDDEEEDFDEEEDDEDEDEPQSATRRETSDNFEHPLSLATVESEIERRINGGCDYKIFGELERAPTVVLGNALFNLQKYSVSKGADALSMDEIKELRHYELLENLFLLTDIDFNDYVDPADVLYDKFTEWQEKNLHKGSAFRRTVLRTLLGSLISLANLHSYSIGELIEEIECLLEDADSAHTFYAYADKINATAEQYSLPTINPDSAAMPIGEPEPEQEEVSSNQDEDDSEEEIAVSPEHHALIELAVSNKWVSYTRAHTMSYSELLAVKNENEPEPAPKPKGKVTKENFRDVIPTLNRQELIQELAARGYSDLSLKKLGAPRLAEMFLNAMERMVNK